MRQPREFYKGGFWHILNRGVAGEKIFCQKEDFRFYLYKIKEFLEKYPVAIHCYNLTIDHFHHLIEQISEISPSKFIGSLHTSYGLHTNRKYSRFGPLCQDRFKAKLVDKNALLPVSIYINLNKILEKLANLKKIKISKSEVDRFLREVEKDPWSSYGVYLGLREDGITKTEFILSLLSDDIEKARKEYQKLAKHFIITGYFLKTRDLIFE